MRLEFGDRELELRYRSYREAVRVWGRDVANAYLRRLNFLLRAQDERTIRSARGLRLHALRGTYAGRSAIDLTGRWRLIVTITSDTVRIEEVSNHYEP